MAIVCEITARAVNNRARDTKIREVIQSPDADFVAMALQLVNLDDTERTAIDLCLRRGLTQEQAAEELDCSVEAVQKWCRSAKDKIWTVWSGRWWMRRIMGE